MKKVKLEVGRDIILKDEATIHESVVNFKPADETFVESTIMQVLYEYQLYARIHVRGTVVKLSDIEEANNGALKLQKFVLMDLDDEISVTLFENHCETVQENESYRFTNVYCEVRWRTNFEVK